MKQGLKIFYDEEEDILYMTKEGQDSELKILDCRLSISLTEGGFHHAF